jgi:acyl dehydratase
MSETTSNRTVTTIDELKELIGQELSVGQWVEMTQERVNQFADVTGDHQYIHVDPERAANTFFGGTIAHGYLTLSLMPLLGKDREGIKVDLGGKMAVNYGVDRVRFPAPVPVGKRIRMRSKLLEVNEIGDSAVQMKYQQTVEVEGQDKPGCVAETLSRIYF